MSEYDSFQRFLFEDLGIRGELVRLDASWEAARARHGYPPLVESQLGQALAAVVLLSATVKFKGSLILQAQGSGPLTTLVAQATHHRAIRGLAHWRGEVGGATLEELYGSGRLVLTIQNEGTEPYQGIVALEGGNLAEAIQTYFSLSEQLATRLWLAADGRRAAGLFIQELPSRQRQAGDWERIALLADTVTEAELLNLPGQELLYRLFNEEKVRLFEPEPVVFRCTCSRDKLEGMLLALGREEVQSVIEERGSLEVDCEFCNRHYHFDRVDVGALFAREVRTPAIRTHQ